MGLDGGYKVIKVEERKEGKVIAKFIYVETTSKKCKCPKCGKHTKSVHDRLKPITLKYVKAFEFITYIVLIKRRFICHGCKYKFAEQVTIQRENKNISNKIEQKVLKDLKQYSLSLKYIAEENNISDNTEHTKDYPKNIINLPRVISFDRFKADTREGKYAFVLNDPIHKETLDVLSNRKKEYLIQYFTYCESYLQVQKIMFPYAKYVVDRFHYIRYIMDG